MKTTMNTSTHFFAKALVLCALYVIASYSLTAQTLSIIPPPIDTVVVGITASRIARVINRGTQVENIRFIAVDTSISKSISLDVNSSLPVRLRPNDTLYLELRINAVRLGLLQGKLLIGYNDKDTVAATIQAFARDFRASDVHIRPGIRPTRDSVKAGDTIGIELYIAQGDRRAILIAAQPVFSGTIAVNSNLLQLLPSERSVRDLGRGLPQVSKTRYIQIPTSAWDGRSDILFRFQAQAMIGDTDQTAIQIVNFQWGGSVTPQPWENKIFIGEPVNSTLTVRTSFAGGKRLFTAAKATSVAIRSTFPNPADTHVEAIYTVPEAQHIELALYNAQGNLVSLIKSGQHAAGEHTASIDTRSLAAGAYFLRVTSADGGIQRATVNVVK